MTAPGLTPFVFVLSPTTLQFDDLYTLAIKTACKDAGVRCERVDQQPRDQHDRRDGQFLTTGLGGPPGGCGQKLVCSRPDEPPR